MLPLQGAARGASACMKKGSVLAHLCVGVEQSAGSVLCTGKDPPHSLEPAILTVASTGWATPV